MKFTNHVVFLFIGQFLAPTIAGPYGPVNYTKNEIQTTMDEEEDDSEWIVANYAFDTPIQLRFSNPVSTTSWVSVFSGGSTAKEWEDEWTESLWMTFCGDQEYDKPSCTEAERKSGIVTIGAGGGIPNQMEYEQWPLNPGPALTPDFYEACVMDWVKNDDGEYEADWVQCLEFTISPPPQTALKNAVIGYAKKFKFRNTQVGEPLKAKFAKIYYSNQWVGLFMKGSTNNPNTEVGLQSAAAHVYTGCDSEEGDQGPDMFLCSVKRKSGPVEIDTTGLEKGQYYLCLVLNNDPPYINYKCHKKLLQLK
eukprot:CAMPEP_0194278556 /NCGR_PEP_ID=MMETSP0169-20130528/11688_1 /TAXON_ID=218684 /ORGANISM="Corethron pennatum, Strain L29A3" /LENGTH=306 /DNA_ID=CAMNT_0039022775 /DNA_START=98 /DNA_END=1018 /DNA_ORIENTATION=+